jgi:hypothetical protein
MWCVADLNRDYIVKMEDVLKTYEQPYDARQPVICLDEKPVTLHADVRPPSAALPGREAIRHNEYKRCGTANVFCAEEPKAGRHFTFPTPDRSAFEFAQVVFQLALEYPKAETIHLVMDNLNIHSRKSLSDLYGAEMAGEVWERFTVHYTPTQAVGSIRRRSKSDSSPGNVSGAEGFPTSRPCGWKPAAGIGE